jgi:hypothetical protein
MVLSLVQSLFNHYSFFARAGVDVALKGFAPSTAKPLAQHHTKAVDAMALGRLGQFAQQMGMHLSSFEIFSLL